MTETRILRSLSLPAWAVCLAILATATACRQTAPVPEAVATPVYNSQTGRLEQLVSDRDGDGKVETRAFMEGTRIVRVEIDRNGDGRPDRWETYAPPSQPGGQGLIERAEQADGATDTITRRETYENGVISRVEEDTDNDGRLDKWETYGGGRLERVDMDLSGKGRADRRLIYGAGGNVERVEADPEGDGTFTLVVQ